MGEFPWLNETETQEAFLEDWYSPWKLFQGERATGKTTVLLCELNRFVRNRYGQILVIAPTYQSVERFFHLYNEIFDEEEHTSFLRENVKFSSSLDSIRGRRSDVVLVDDLHNMHGRVLEEIQPMNPDFVRASVWLGEIDSEYTREDPPQFHSVYRE